MSPKMQRYARERQAEHRGSRRSYKTELENLQLLLCWESEQLSEGQMARILDIDRVSLRKMRLDAIDAGMVIAEALTPPLPARRMPVPELAAPDGVIAGTTEWTKEGIPLPAPPAEAPKEHS